MNEKEKELINELIKAIDENSTGLWVDDLSETVDCVILDTQHIKEGDEESEAPTYYTGINYAVSNLTNYMKKEEANKVVQAKQTLKRNGYIVDNLWQTGDIKQNYICDNDTAEYIVSKALCSEQITSATFEIMDEYAEEAELKRVDNEN
jgi:hypothetical protein|tara:strand:- start:31061 stop:31507 length:447 start_codon:yes stop_codon:yes gene_type:complete